MGLKKHLKDFAACYLVGAMWLAQPVTAVWMNSKFRDIGEGFSVREIGNRREFYVGTKMGAARLCVDKDMNGSLDQVMVNVPISAMMGGPGYRLMETQITDEDRERFARSTYLFNQRN